MTTGTRLIVALDVPNAGEARRVLRELEGLPLVYKVGFELFVSEGPGFVKELTSVGREVFLDLKFHDIPNTVLKGAQQAQALGVSMFTLHIAGGRKMIETVRAGLDLGPRRPWILGVTVLTSFDEKGWGEVSAAVSGSASATRPSVERLARVAAEWGCDGLVCSPLELEAVNRVAPALKTVIPGIRPAGAAAGDQSRTMTPAEAHARGATAVVMGRPILQASDPRAAAQAALLSLKSAN